MKAKYSVMLIPNEGDAIHKPQLFISAVYAQASGRSEAKLIFKTTAAQSVEVVVLQGRLAISSLCEMIRK